MNEAMNVKYVPVINPGAIVDNASFTCAEIDTMGFGYVQFLFQFGATDIAMAALKLTESDTSGSGFTDVDGADYSTDSTLPSATTDNKIYAINVATKARKRYLKPVATAGDGSTGTYLSAIAVLSRPSESPTSATGRGFAAELTV